MKINEVADVVQHPAMKRNNEYDRLINSDDIDDLVAYVMDDNNPQERRLNMLRHLDSLLGDEKEVYDADDLEDFMHDSGELSDEEADEIARDLGFPPYHLKPVEEETFSSDADIPTGEYEICDRCFGDGCEKCEGGLVDVTGEFEVPNFDDLI
jgi:hypothetical protein